jgi:hypothetical protein
MNSCIVAKNKFGGIFSFLKKIPKNEKQIAKVFQTIKLNKKLMPNI